MDEKRLDPRALRSKKRLKEAVVALLTENPKISALTVQKVTTKAELNRATFYLHYVDLPHLLQELMQDVLKGLNDKLTPMLHNQKHSDRQHLLIYLDYFYEQRKLIYLLFEDTEFRRSIHAIMKSFITSKRELHSIVSDKSRVEIDVLVASIVGIITWWINEGIDYSSEFITNQIEGLYRR